MGQIFGSNKPMSTDEQIREWIGIAEKREMARTGLNKPEARKALSRNLGLSYWSLVNIIRGRVKGLRGDLRDRIKAGIIRNIEGEITRLENELVVVHHCDANLSKANILGAEAALEQARAFLRKD